jgi:hypothetical protein
LKLSDKMEAMTEIKEIEGYPNYLIYSDGRVWSKKNKKFLKGGLDTRGYPMVNLGIDGKNKRIHKLVALCFISNPENKPQVNHIDGNKVNNDISNLEWVTGLENMRHSFEIGLHKKLKGKDSHLFGKFGKEHPCSIFIIQRCLTTGNILNRFYGMAEAARQTDCAANSICAVCKGKRKSAGGFGWEYAK